MNLLRSESPNVGFVCSEIGREAVLEAGSRLGEFVMEDRGLIGIPIHI